MDWRSCLATCCLCHGKCQLKPFKARQQYGLRVFSEIGLVLPCWFYIFLCIPTKWLCCCSGFGWCTSQLFRYVLHAFKKADMAKGIYIAFGFQGFPSLGLFLHFLLVQTVALHLWARFSTLLFSHGCFLPRSLRIYVFEKQDFFTF